MRTMINIKALTHREAMAKVLGPTISGRGERKRHRRQLLNKLIIVKSKLLVKFC